MVPLIPVTSQFLTALKDLTGRYYEPNAFFLNLSNQEFAM